MQVGGGTLRLCGLSNATYCNIICLNLLHSEVAGMKNIAQVVLTTWILGVSAHALDTSFRNGSPK